MRTLILDVKKHSISTRLRDDQADARSIKPKQQIQYSSPPKSMKLKLVYNEQTSQVRIFYGFAGAEAITEIPDSKAGIYFAEPLTESTTIFLLFSSGSMELDHFQIEPR